MKLLTDLQRNTVPNVNRTQENVEDVNTKELIPRGGNQQFYWDGARSSITNRRNGKFNNQDHREVIGNGNGQGDGNRLRLSQNDRYRDRRGNLVNHQVNFLDMDDGPGNERAPYWTRNRHRRGYWNPRPVNQGCSGRTVRERERRYRLKREVIEIVGDHTFLSCTKKIQKSRWNGC